MSAIGLDPHSPQRSELTMYTSHEALLLEYEEAMSRIDTTTGRWYDTSAHMLWIGDRTRQIGGAHVEFMRGVCNPVGIKVGPTYDTAEMKRLFERLNPGNEAGRLVMISRLGADRTCDLLPSLLREMRKEGFRIAWVCDPMHGNTHVTRAGRKTRVFESIVRELRSFWQIHEAEGSVAAGVHIELTGEDVTECVGGSGNLADSDLGRNYQTHCDPRLNCEQAVELAFEIADILAPKEGSQNDMVPGS